MENIPVLERTHCVKRFPNTEFFSGPFFPVFSPNAWKYGPEKTPYLDILRAVTTTTQTLDRSSHPQVFLRKGLLKICSKLAGEHQRQSAISIKLQSNFTEIALLHGCSPVNLLHIFRTYFPKNTSGGLLLLILINKQ